MDEDKKRLELEEDMFDDDDEDAQKDKYLTFHLAKEDYAVEIRFVTEIIGIQRITEVPDMPDFVRGVINLRGKIIPVIDVRTRFKLESRDYDDRTCIIVVDINDMSVGLVVDEVSEVANIPENQVEPPPRAASGQRGRFIQGMGKMGEDVLIILDVSKLLYAEEMDMIKTKAEKGAVKKDDAKESEAATAV